MPPGARTDPQRARFAALKAAQTSARFAFGCGAMSWLRAWCQHSAIRPRARRIPGTTPARKSWLIEVSDITPQTTIGIEGGSIGPMIPPATASAVAKGRE